MKNHRFFFFLKKLKTTAGPVYIFPEKHNHIGSAVTEILNLKYDILPCKFITNAKHFITIN